MTRQTTRQPRAAGRLAALALAFVSAAGLTACALPDKPVRPALYDFGPGVQALPQLPAQALADPLVLADVEAGGIIDSTAVLYRLSYADPHQLRTYALARWSLPPSQLLRQRLREVLSQQQQVLNPGELAPPARAGGQRNRVLRIEIEEFAHHFAAPERSAGVVRLRATLLEPAASGERVLAQRSFTAQQAAATPDASGGVLALAAATGAVGQDIASWLRSQR